MEDGGAPGAPGRGSTRVHVPALGKIGVIRDFEPVYKEKRNP
jgi:hypothetical protein